MVTMKFERRHSSTTFFGDSNARYSRRVLRSGATTSRLFRGGSPVSGNAHRAGVPPGHPKLTDYPVDSVPVT